MGRPAIEAVVRAEAVTMRARSSRFCAVAIYTLRSPWCLSLRRTIDTFTEMLARAKTQAAAGHRSDAPWRQHDRNHRGNGRLWPPPPRRRSLKNSLPCSKPTSPARSGAQLVQPPLLARPAPSAPSDTSVDNPPPPAMQPATPVPSEAVVDSLAPAATPPVPPDASVANLPPSAAQPATSSPSEAAVDSLAPAATPPVPPDGSVANLPSPAAQPATSSPSEAVVVSLAPAATPPVPPEYVRGQPATACGAIRNVFGIRPCRRPPITSREHQQDSVPASNAGKSAI